MEYKIIHIERDELSINYKYYNNSENLSGIKIVSYEYELDDLKKTYNFYPLGRNPIIGDTYILDPFSENRYILEEHFTDEVLKSKQHCISEIARCLGASNFKYSLKISNSNKRDITVDVDGKYKVVEADISVDISRVKKLNKLYSIEQKTKGISSFEEYNKAEDIAKKNGVYNEPDIRTLFEGRNPNSTNKIQKRTFQFIVSNEINSSKDIAFNLCAFDIFKLNSSFKSLFEIKEEIKGILEIEFND